EEDSVVDSKDIFADIEIDLTPPFADENDKKEEKEESEKVETYLKDIDLNDVFPERLHKLIFFAKNTIESSPNSTLSVAHIEFSNRDEIENKIANFKMDSFFGDIQFVIMNVVGTNGFVQIYQDLSIYIVLPEIDTSMTKQIVSQVISEIKTMFNEIIGETEVTFNQRVVNYPDTARDYLEIFYNVIDL
ncbi:MAG TPA: hypothetical protein PK771_14240, partial [Spirochaetota bacterium]|nr:hypothetical protein [Spirochaetota bacterium]